MNMIKTKANKAMLSLTLATALFFSPSINGSTAHAIVTEIDYNIDHAISKDFTYIEDKYNNNLSNKTVILTTNAYGTRFYHCPRCNRDLYMYPRQLYCSNCGQKVTWE